MKRRDLVSDSTIGEPLLDPAAIEHAAKTAFTEAGGTWDDGSSLCQDGAHKRTQEQWRQKARSFVRPYLKATGSLGIGSLKK